MTTWRYTTRKIDGKKRHVKVLKVKGKELVRVVGYRNTTDANAGKR